LKWTTLQLPEGREILVLSFRSLANQAAIDASIEVVLVTFTPVTCFGVI
jgi:hypothetical protein